MTASSETSSTETTPTETTPTETTPTPLDLAGSEGTDRRRPPRLADSADFVRWIGSRWAEQETAAPVTPAAAESAAAHRRRFREAAPGASIVVAAGRAPVRNDDVSFDFRAHSDFLWLTGAPVEGAVLVVHADPTADATLYVVPPARPGEVGFFADPAHGELWVGPSAGRRQWRQALGIDVRPLDELPAGIAAPPRGVAPLSGAGTDPSRLLSDLRRVKDDWEIAQLREAVDHTVTGFEQVAGELARAVELGPRGERWLQGTFDRHARYAGNGPGYTSIVGSGPHAPTLHWVRCDGPVLPDRPLLLDLGVEASSGYTADVTRTVPPSGRFDQTQRAVHDLVERSHRAGLAAVAPGRRFSDFHYAALEVIAAGLSDWGVLPVSVDEALTDAGQQHRRWLCCGIGHHLGLDVHDCGRSEFAEYHGADLEPGMLLTVEPGLYFHANDLAVPPELRGIGIRIEDDLLVTPDGHEVLSAALPIDADGLEAWTSARAAGGPADD